MQLTNIDSMTALRIAGAEQYAARSGAEPDLDRAARDLGARRRIGVCGVDAHPRRTSGDGRRCAAVSTAHMACSASRRRQRRRSCSGSATSKPRRSRTTEPRIRTRKKPISNDIQQLLGDIDQTAGGAEFNGLKPLTPTVPGAAVSFIADTSGYGAAGRLQGHDHGRLGLGRLRARTCPTSRWSRSTRRSRTPPTSLPTSPSRRARSMRTRQDAGCPVRCARGRARLAHRRRHGTRFGDAVRPNNRASRWRSRRSRSRTRRRINS